MKIRMSSVNLAASQFGANSPAWKGGRNLNGPKAGNWRGGKTLRNTGYINGIKTDNRVENLELWSSSHPAGQRVVDLVEWAKSILKQYPDHV